MERSPHQYELISVADCYEDLDDPQKVDLRAHLGRVVMANLELIYTLTDQLTRDGIEAKSRRRRLQLPPEWLGGAE